MRFFKRKILKILILIVIILIVVVWLLVRSIPIRQPKAFGVTYSSFYAEQFGLDWQKTYLALFDDLGIKKIRLPAYWSEVEASKGAFDFSRLDWEIQEAQKRGAEVILAVGRKLPRWPECHEPAWAHQLVVDNKTDEFNNALLNYVQVTVERYRNDSAVALWQIENEPYLPFGDCTNYSAAMLDREMVLVRALDSRPIMITDSGELSFWVSAAKRADVFGSTMYRSVHNKIFGDITYPLPPAFFRLKQAYTQLLAGKKSMIVVELQGEPWTREATYKTSAEDNYKTMNPDAFRGI